MNIYFGAYGKEEPCQRKLTISGSISGIWRRTMNFPNGNFEYGDGLYPWEGDAQIDKNNVKDGKQALSIASGKQISQYVYVDHTSSYCLEY